MAVACTRTRTVDLVAGTRSLLISYVEIFSNREGELLSDLYGGLHGFVEQPPEHAQQEHL